jgi:hypothetical protein
LTLYWHIWWHRAIIIIKFWNIMCVQCQVLKD